VHVPLDFLRRKGRPERREAPAVGVLSETPNAEDFELKLTYRAKSSQGVRMRGGPDALARLPAMLSEFAKTAPELVEPLDVRFQAAAPRIVRVDEATQWLNAHHGRSAITRHALMVLESLDAIDPAFEASALALLSGETDTAGYPEYDAIVGGVVSHWDEVSGDQVVRAVVGWGGRGVRGDTDRAADRTLAGLVASILATQGAIGMVEVERPVPQAGGGGLVCAHCQYASAHERAFFCPRCGMRMLRG
jgi:hypothetical protein